MDNSIIKVGDILVLNLDTLRCDPWPWYYLVVDLDVKNMTVDLFKITDAYYDGINNPIRKNMDLTVILRDFNNKTKTNTTYWRFL